ncbi:response regulator [bacterium]|nr:response regulator [bacterium]
MARPTVLIIDDSREEINLCEFILNSVCRVIGAVTGGEGLRLAAREDPDLILVDQRLGRRDGFEVCRRLIGDEATRYIPIVILGSATDEQGQSQAASLGLVDYIAKPLIPAYFSKRVQTILERYAGRINRCTSCLHPMQKDWKFCPYDGAPLPPLPEKKPREN